MTPKEKDGTDVDAVQISSSKELDAEVASFLAAFRDKETEYNWEARDRSLTRLRGILRGNAAEKYHDALMLGIRQMVDGIIKAIESLRTSLALNALNVVAEIGIYLGKSVDAYIYDRLLDCLFKCASTTKKVIASASLKATTTFISHATYHHKLMNMLGMMMNEKNNQVRLFTVTYTKTVLQAHAHRDHTRAVLDRTGGTDILVKILEKGLSDATPAVRENCRDAFWIFHENWKERGENLLRSLQPAIRKAVEKSKAKAMQNHRSIHSPTNSSSSLRTSSSLGSHRNISDIHDALSPSTSTASNGSSGSSEPHPTPDIRKPMTRSVSPRASSPSIRSTSPHLLRSFGSPPPTSWQLHSSHAAPSSPPPSTSRKTRVPTLTRKKSTISTKRKLSLFSMLSHDDLSLRCDGLRMLARKLAEHPYSSSPDLQSIQLESTHGVLDGEKLKTIVWNMLQEDNARLYEALSGWDAVAGVLVKLLTFEELIPKLILDATADAVSLRTDDDITRHEAAISAFKRVKVYLKRYDPNLADQLLTALIMTSAATPKRPLQSMAVSKKDPMRNPANRRKLTSKYLEWMDELVTPILGLDGGEDTVVDEPESKEWIADAPNNVASQWFESDAHVRQYLEQLLPLVSTSTPGSIVHEPLISLVGHLRLVNQKLFETIAGTFDSKTITKISRILGIHIRVIPDYVCQSSSPINDESLAAVQGNEQEVQTTEIAQELAEEEEQQHVVEQREIPEQMQEEEEEEEEEEVDEEPPKVNQVPPTAYSPDNDTTDPTITTEQPKSTTMRVEHTTAIKTIDDTYEHDTESPVQNVPLSEIPEVHDERFVPESTPAQAVISPAHFDPRLDDLNIPDTTPYDNRPLVLPLGSSEYMLPKMRPFESNGTTESQHHPADFVAPNSPPAAAAGLAALNTEQSIASHSISTAAKRRPYENNITHVPYFAPSQVSEPWPTLKENKRSEPSTAATNGRSTRDKTSTLYALVDKLKSMTVDNATVRKLTRLAREAPVMQPWDQGGSEEPGSDLWAGAETNGGNFVEVVQGAILYLDGSQKTLTVLELVRQLASTQGGLFRYCERRVDEQGMSLEARLMERLLAVRASPDASVSTAAEDALDSLIRVLDPMNVFEILLSFLAYQLCISPMSNEQQMAHTSRYHPLGSAFTYLGKCVQEVRDTFFVEEWLIKAGAVVFLKGLNHPSIHVRKSCVETIVQFHGVMGDDIYQFLDELRTDQVNLVRHYVSRAIKKKAGARSLSGTPVI